MGSEMCIRDSLLCFDNDHPRGLFRAQNGQRANFFIFGPLLASFELWGRPRGADWRPKHFHTLCLGGTHPYHVLGPLNGHLRPPKGPVLASIGPFGGPGGPRRAPGGQIWSRLPPIGPSGLDSCSPQTLTWYRAPFRHPGALTEPVLARNASFGALGGHQRAPREQIWSRLPPIGPPWLDSCPSYTLTWYWAPSGSPRGQKGLFVPGPQISTAKFCDGDFLFQI